MFHPRILAESNSDIASFEAERVNVPKSRWFPFRKNDHKHLIETVDAEHCNQKNSSPVSETSYSSETNLADIEASRNSSNGCGFFYLGNMFRSLKRKIFNKKTRSKAAKKTKFDGSPKTPKPKKNEPTPTTVEEPIEHVHVVSPLDLCVLPQNILDSHSLAQEFDWNLFNQLGNDYVAVQQHQNETNAPKQRNKKRNNKNRNRKNRERNNNQQCKNVIKPLEIMLDPKLEKYWKNRYRLFSKYDEGIILDAESWYSVTPEKISKEIAQRCQCDVIIDGFCGAGGNTIQFAFTCERVIAIDIDENKISLAKHNAKIYGVDDRIEFIVGDFFQVVPSLKADVVFLSPPWGGPEYNKMTDYPLNRIEPRGGKELFNVAKQVTEHIAYYLPRNVNKTEIACLGNDYVKIDSHYLNNRVIAVTAYFGDLAEEYDDFQ